MVLKIDELTTAELIKQAEAAVAIRNANDMDTGDSGAKPMAARVFTSEELEDVEGFEPLEEGEAWGKLSSSIADTTSQLQLQEEAMRSAGETATTYGNVASQAFGMIAQNAAASGNTQLATFARVVQGMAPLITKLIAQSMAVSTANAIQGGTQSGTATGAGAIVSIPAMIATLVGVVGTAFSSMPKFATGGQSRGGTALVGERGPEMVNLPKGSFVSPNHQSSFATSGMGSSGMITVRGSIVGRDIQLSNSRTNKFNSRTTGIGR